jgi:tRNA(Ile)-lysidine synthase
MGANLEAKLKETISKHNMLSRGDYVLLGLSGGPDSTCLLSLLSNLVDEFELTLSAMYIDHGLRPDETPDEIRSCTALCTKLGVSFSVEKIELDKEKGNLQESARDNRYWKLEVEALQAGANRIALGHTLDDQVETFMMRVLRGAGPAGLAGIPPVRGKIIRPLIAIRKNEILNYIDEKKLTYCTDSSNLKTDYLRNRLRKEIMPTLEDINPSLTETLGRTMDILAEEEKYFFIQVNKTLMRMISSKGDDHIELFQIPMETLDRAILRRVLRRAVQETRDLKRLGHVHIEDIIRLIKEGHPGGSLDLPNGIKVIRKYSTLLITSAPPVRISEQEILEQGIIALPELRKKISIKIVDAKPAAKPGSNHCVLDAEKTTLPLKLRAREDGDLFYPSGFGRKKKLQDFFVDAKVPRYERDAIPIITCGDDIVWIAGYRADERYAATEKTRSFLVLELI